MAKKDDKTNVMRILDQKKVPYTPYTYPYDGGTAPDGEAVARMLGKPPAAVYKTLVTRGASGGYYVFDIPVAETLDLKKAAKAVGEKSIAMLPGRELLPLTGYVHGGCSPVGMKKLFPTVFHDSAELQDAILVSAGRIGYQVEVRPADLIALVRAKTADVTMGGGAAADGASENKYPCPCCGYLTFPAPKEAAIAYICPVCYWENDIFDPDEDAPSDENQGMTLRQGRENFKRWGAVRPEFVKYARPPKPSETAKKET